MSSEVDDVRAHVIEQLRDEISKLRATLNAANTRVELLARGLEPLATLYHEAMDDAPRPVVPLIEHPIPRVLRLADLKAAREAYVQAMLPDFSGAQTADVEAPIEAWCDGSGTSLDSEAGGGIVLMVPGCDRVERGIYLGKGTNNFAELNAIRHAVLMLTEMKVPTSRKILVYSDSEYAIGALTKSWDIKANADIVDATKAVCRRYPGLRLIHVKGHAGNEGNEAADKLAGAAAAAQSDVFSVAQAVEILRAHKAAQRSARQRKEHKIAP